MPTTQHIKIAIDGFSACGKSTLAKQLAARFNFKYIDSGAMYRCVALHLMKKNIPLEHESMIEKELENIHIELSNIGNKYICLLNGKNVSADIRDLKLQPYLSAISNLGCVRRKLAEIQKKMGEIQNIVMDGRDIGTHIFPDATLKLFMTATPEIRAERRLKELQENGKENISFNHVLSDLKKRDENDINRKINPLIKADDAFEIDNSYMSMDEQFELACKLLNDVMKST